MAMVGWISFPRSEKAPVVPTTVDKLHPPLAYSYAESSRFSQPYAMGTLGATAIKTSRASHFLSLPPWKHRASSDVGEMGQLLTRNDLHVGETRKILRASSYNVDKALPAIPCPSDLADSSGRSSDAEAASRQSQPARTLAQAGLGISLPLVVPSAAAKFPSASVSTSKRPCTAPRPVRLETSPVVRRVKSFTRLLDGGNSSRHPLSVLSIGQGGFEPPVIANHQDENTGINGPAVSIMSEPRAATRRSSFWHRRRTQSYKDSLVERSAGPDVVSTPIPPLPKYLREEPQSCIEGQSRIPGRTQFGLPPALHRRHSERSVCPSHQSTYPQVLPHREHPHKRSPRRPSTAGDATRMQHMLNAASNGPANPVYPFSRTSRYNAASLSSLAAKPMQRPRSMTSPHSLLHRLSMGFFDRPSPNSPIAASSGAVYADFRSSSPDMLPSSHRKFFPKTTIGIPKPRESGESPESFLRRVREVVGKAEIAHVLASSGETIYSHALLIYIDGFDFSNDPLDIALRKLLMEVELPKETQQIDRVMEAFAASYCKSNPGLFFSEDHPYILAFSLIMLHTDAFNKSNKRKMTKADYIKNTKLFGVPTEVLGYFYENTVFAPFIFIEEPLGVNGHRGVILDARIQQSLKSNVPTGAIGTGLSVLGKSNKIDPYYLITQNLLSPLRMDVERYIPQRNPFSYQGNAGYWNQSELRRSFLQAYVVQMDTVETKRMSVMPFLSTSAANPAKHTTTDGLSTAVFEHESADSYLKTLRITKVGLLNRKDDLSSGGVRATKRKWREWSVMLAGSHLLFFRDASVATDIIGRHNEKEAWSDTLSRLRTDEVLPIKGAIAVYDSSYVKHSNVLHLIIADGRQILLQTDNAVQRNEWIAHINYSSAFKSTGIKMRPVYPLVSSRMDRESCIHNTPKDRMIVAGAEKRSPLNRSSEDSATSHLFRSRMISSKIRELEANIITIQEKLTANIRMARNFAILTPFQKTTHARLQASTIELGQHIRQLRLDIIRTSCYRDVLAAELESEEREPWHSEQDGSRFSKRPVSSRDASLPRMSVSLHQDRTPDVRLSRSDISETSEGGRESSNYESCHSYLDFVGWHFDTPLASQRQHRSKQMGEMGSALVSPCEEVDPGESTRIGYSVSVHDQHSHAPSSISTSASFTPEDLRSPKELRASELGVPDGDIEEQAEEWNKTKAARRVSLVRVPSSLHIAKEKRESWRPSTCTEHSLNNSLRSLPDVSLMPNISHDNTKVLPPNHI